MLEVLYQRLTINKALLDRMYSDDEVVERIRQEEALQFK
jgi:hypothetical protein